MPVVKWRDGPFELNTDDDVSIGKNVLQLLNVTETKNYTCVASSDLGNIESVAEVKVRGECLVAYLPSIRILEGDSRFFTLIL